MSARPPLSQRGSVAGDGGAAEAERAALGAAARGSPYPPSLQRRTSAHRLLTPPCLPASLPPCLPASLTAAGAGVGGEGGGASGGEAARGAGGARGERRSRPRPPGAADDGERAAGCGPLASSSQDVALDPSLTRPRRARRRSLSGAHATRRRRRSGGAGPHGRRSSTRSGPSSSGGAESSRRRWRRPSGRRGELVQPPHRAARCFTRPRLRGWRRSTWPRSARLRCARRSPQPLPSETRRGARRWRPVTRRRHRPAPQAPSVCPSVCPSDRPSPRQKPPQPSPPPRPPSPLVTRTRPPSARLAPSPHPASLALRPSTSAPRPTTSARRSTAASCW